MKVNLFVSKDIAEPHADIHTNELTDNVSKAISILESDESNELIAAKKGSDIVLLEYSEVYMFRVENKQVKVYTNDSEYQMKKPLYQVEESLDSDFVRISKTT
ncbi:MAG: LytTR family transcriptional regulator, partial [Methanobrevibacter sp.]|nr:LytTR family transcriptional regulator [Methanobrevibacter sp.]